MNLVTQSDHDDLRDQVTALKNYMENLEKRLDGQHQELAENTANHLVDIYSTLNGERDTGEGPTHSLLVRKEFSGSIQGFESQIQDADRLEDERFLAEFLAD